jgi:hypothetical protein
MFDAGRAGETRGRSDTFVNSVCAGAGAGAGALVAECGADGRLTRGGNVSALDLAVTPSPATGGATLCGNDNGDGDTL